MRENRLRRVIVLERLAHCRLGVEMVERQSEDTGPCLGPETHAVRRDSQPRCRRDLTYDREVAGAKHDHPDGLGCLAKDAQAQAPALYVPTRQVVPVSSQYALRSVDRRAVGPRRQKGSLVGSVNAAPGEASQLPELLVVGKTQRQASGGGLEGERWPDVVDHHRSLIDPKWAVLRISDATGST